MTTHADAPIGLIGLGNAGTALATALSRYFSLLVHDLDASRIQGSGLPLRAASSATQVAQACEVIFLSLPTPEASRDVALALAQVSLAGKVIIETSTVNPDDVDAFSAIIRAAGGAVIDAAIVGGVHKLAQGRTAFLVGAADTDLARVRPVLEAAAEDIFHLGPTGNGMRTKVVVNAVAHTTMVMLLEAGAMAVKAGIPIETFLALMKRESGLTRPLMHRFCERILEQNFEGGMPTANARKDSVLATDLAHKLGVPLFTIPAAHTVYEIANNTELARLDYASISKLWERWLDIEFGRPDASRS